MAVSGASGPSRVVVPERRPESDRTQGSAPGTFGCSSPARRASDVQSKPSASANLEHLGYRELGSLHFAERANRDLARRDAARQGFLGKPSFAGTSQYPTEQPRTTEPDKRVMHTFVFGFQLGEFLLCAIGLSSDNGRGSLPILMSGITRSNAGKQRNKQMSSSQVSKPVSLATSTKERVKRWK